MNNWQEDEDVTDEYRARAIKVFGNHTGGEPVTDAILIRGKWVIFTTELGAYRYANKNIKGFHDLGESFNVNPGTWYVWA